MLMNFDSFFTSPVIGRKSAAPAWQFAAAGEQVFMKTETYQKRKIKEGYKKSNSEEIP